MVRHSRTRLRLALQPWAPPGNTFLVVFAELYTGLCASWCSTGLGHRVWLARSIGTSQLNIACMNILRRLIPKGGDGSHDPVRVMMAMLPYIY